MTMQRTAADLLEATRYGKLYRIVGCHGSKFIAGRCRVVRGELVIVKGERITLERREASKLEPEVDDFCFVDNGPKPCWALWKVTKG